MNDRVAAEAVLMPQPWSEGGRVHNWRNYVGFRTRHMWDDLSDSQKVAIATDADDLADKEDWE